MAKMRVKETVYTQRVEVIIPPGEPRWLDMMRYDCCYPATSADASKLVRLASGEGRGETGERVTFLRRTGAPSDPTVERWASFGCRVVYFGEP